jgi:hypothetical protein
VFREFAVKLFLKIRDIEFVPRTDAKTQPTVGAVVKLYIWGESPLRGRLHRDCSGGTNSAAPTTSVTQPLSGNIDEERRSHDL